MDRLKFLYFLLFTFAVFRDGNLISGIGEYYFEDDTSNYGSAEYLPNEKYISEKHSEKSSEKAENLLHEKQNVLKSIMLQHPIIKSECMEELENIDHLLNKFQNRNKQNIKEGVKSLDVGKMVGSKNTVNRKLYSKRTPVVKFEVHSDLLQYTKSGGLNETRSNDICKATTDFQDCKKYWRDLKAWLQNIVHELQQTLSTMTNRRYLTNQVQTVDMDMKALRRYLTYDLTNDDFKAINNLLGFTVEPRPDGEESDLPLSAEAIFNHGMQAKIREVNIWFGKIINNLILIIKTIYNEYIENVRKFTDEYMGETNVITIDATPNMEMLHLRQIFITDIITTDDYKQLDMLFEITVERIKNLWDENSLQGMQAKIREVNIWFGKKFNNLSLIIKTIYNDYIENVRKFTDEYIGERNVINIDATPNMEMLHLRQVFISDIITTEDYKQLNVLFEITVERIKNLWEENSLQGIQTRLREACVWFRTQINDLIETIYTYQTFYFWNLKKFLDEYVGRRNTTEDNYVSNTEMISFYKFATHGLITEEDGKKAKYFLDETLIPAFNDVLEVLITWLHSIPKRLLESITSSTYFQQSFCHTKKAYSESATVKNVITAPEMAEQHLRKDTNIYREGHEIDTIGDMTYFKTRYGITELEYRKINEILGRTLKPPLFHKEDYSTKGTPSEGTWFKTMLDRLYEGLKNTCKKIELEFPILYNLKNWYESVSTIEKTINADRDHGGSFSDIKNDNEVNGKIADSPTMGNRNDNNGKVLNNLKYQNVSDEKGHVDDVQSDNEILMTNDDEFYGNDVDFVIDDDDFYGHDVDFVIDDDGFYGHEADFATDEMTDNHNLNKNEVDYRIDYKLTKNDFYVDNNYFVIDRPDDNSFDYINDEIDFDEGNDFDGEEWMELHEVYEYDEEFSDVTYQDEDKVSEGRRSNNE